MVVEEQGKTNYFFILYPSTKLEFKANLQAQEMSAPAMQGLTGELYLSVLQSQYSPLLLQWFVPEHLFCLKLDFKVESFI